MVGMGMARGKVVASVRPVEGYVLRLRFAGRDVVLWWGQDESGRDCVAAENGRVRAWADRAECLSRVRAWGWPEALVDGDDAVLQGGRDVPGDRDVSEGRAIDAGPVLEWLRGRRLSLDSGTALGVWNLAGDVAFSTGAAWHDRGRLADECYDKLVAANLPWLTTSGAYSPRWTASELDYLRRRMNESVAVLRAALT